MDFLDSVSITCARHTANEIGATITARKTLSGKTLFRLYLSPSHMSTSLVCFETESPEALDAFLDGFTLGRRAGQLDSR